MTEHALPAPGTDPREERDGDGADWRQQEELEQREQEVGHDGE